MRQVPQLLELLVPLQPLEHRAISQEVDPLRALIRHRPLALQPLLHRLLHLLPHLLILDEEPPLRVDDGRLEALPQRIPDGLAGDVEVRGGVEVYGPREGFGDQAEVRGWDALGGGVPGGVVRRGEDFGARLFADVEAEEGGVGGEDGVEVGVLSGAVAYGC